MFVLAELSKLSLVQDLAAVMLVAGLVAALFHYLGWPKVIGYIVAGALMGLDDVKPFLISNEDSVNVLANLGVIFLMFTLGLELNIRRLRKTGGIVFPTAACDLVIMLLAGYALGRHVFHWEMLPSLFLGAVLCDSSTTLLAKSLEEMGCTHEPFATIIFGTTITEDILTIGLMAILTGLALTGKFQAMELAQQLGMLMLFLIGVLVFGLIMLPKFLNSLRKLKDDETLLIIILGVCFGISFVAEKMNFSLALGAFLVGAVVSESCVSARVHESTGALRSMFSAVFFVTIGLMINPTQFWECKYQILAASLVVLIGKTVNCMTASYAMGQPRQDALKTGVGLAQIGDFAYLVALMGITTSGGTKPYPQMYQIAVGTSILTTLINPFLLKASVPASNWLENHTPAKLRETLDNYTMWTRRAGSQVGKADTGRSFKRHIAFFLIDLALIAVVFMTAHYFSGQEQLWHAMPHWLANFRDPLLWLACCFVTFSIMVSAFLHARRLAADVSAASVPSFLRESWAQPMRRITSLIVILLCMALLAIEFTFLSALLFFDWYILGVTITIYLLLCLFCWKKIKGIALDGQKTLALVLDKEDDTHETPGQKPAVVTVPAVSGAIGITLRRLRIRNRTGATVLSITRSDGTVIHNPGPDDMLMAGDTLELSATEKQAADTTSLLAQIHIEPQEDLAAFSRMLELHVDTVQLSHDAPSIGMSLKQLKLRNRAGTTVVRIEHADRSAVDNPGPDQTLDPGDTIFLLGTSQQIKNAVTILLPVLPPDASASTIF